MTTTRIKLCGITNIDDALMGCDLGVDALGFIFADSPRRVTPEAAARIAAATPPFIKKIGVFTEQHPRVAQIVASVPIDLIQLHGGQSDEFASQFEAARVIRGLRIRDELSLTEMLRYNHCSAYLLDTFTKDKLGGTSKTFDWEVAVKAKRSGKPIILAGGLTPENVAAAIAQVRPFAVDVCSGVELEPGKKDYAKLKEFIANVRAADEEYAG
jgi:phosphoribosylanthranilate isomerase